MQGMINDEYMSLQVRHHYPQEKKVVLNSQELENYRERIKRLLLEKNAVLVAHYYVDKEIQRLAEETGGTVADSLEMARFGANHPAQTLIVAGVRFMGETAKILSPQKTILIPRLDAECSLDLSCPAEVFSRFCDLHPDRKVVVYANTSAAVKARADWVVTSSIALKVIDELAAMGEKIIWASDKYLGSYLQKETGADMLLWNGSCIVHEEFKANGIKNLLIEYPDAAVLVHPESPAEVIELADVVGSTVQLLVASQKMNHQTFIVATDGGILYKMQQASPDKMFIAAPTGGTGATCRSCAYCPWMGLNSLINVADTLESGCNEITIAEDIRRRALLPLERMLDFAKRG